jgi:hypothetical protein
MPLRSFTDPSGVEWAVWDTFPTAPGPVRETYGGGWLTFEAKALGAKRRLAPVPLYWANADEAELHQLLARAKPVEPTPPRGVERLE